MTDRVSRREAIGRLTAASAGVALSAGVLRGGAEILAAQAGPGGPEGAASAVQPARGGAEATALVVAGRPAEIVVSPVSEATVRISVLPLDAGRPADVPLDGSLVQATWGPAAGRIRDLGAAPPIRAGRFVVRGTPGPPMVHIETDGGALVQRLTFDAERPDVLFHLGEGPLLGLGQGGPQFDRRGSVDRMRSGQGAYQLRTHGGRVPVQWLIGTGAVGPAARSRRGDAEGWAMFVHQPLGRFDLTGPEGRFVAFDGAPLLDVFIVGSRDPAVIMAEYARLTGAPELPPLWSLGYLQSHRTLAGPDEILDVARTFREKKLPCDALIYLGTGFTPSGWNAANGSFAFNPRTFPDPKGLIDELHALHFRIVLHVVILARDLRGAVADGCNFARFDEEQAGCYWHLHRRLIDLGVDGWWPDEGDPLDARARLARNRMYWEGPQLDRPGERVFALHRNGHAGMQRYAGFLWSGDVYSTWKTLETHVPVAINTGLSGIPYWGTDIGGFVPTPEYTGELHVRWFQFGAFCPLFRAHGRTWHLRLPWGWSTGELGPDEIATYAGGAGNPVPAERRHPEVEAICRRYLELRYRLLPYTYTAVREAHDTGLPIMRALWLHYPEDAAAVARGDEYLWGRDLLVAPVTRPGASTWRLYLPHGRWVDFWTHETIEGGREIERRVDLATMPLYVRAGAVVPTGPVKQYTDEPVEAPLTLTVYPGADGGGALYEDDGRTVAYRQGEWMRIAMVWRDAARSLEIRLAEGSKPRGLPRRFEIRVAGREEARVVTFDGRPLVVKL